MNDDKSRIPGTWGERFRKSFFGFRCLQNITTAEVEQSLDRICAKRHVSPDLLAAAMEALLEQHARKQVLGLVDQILAVTESPLESVMAIALLISAREKVGQVSFLGRTWRSAWTPAVLAIYPQAKVDRFRVNFLLVLRNDETDAERRLIIECDGREFHERTPAQAAADRARDRALQAAGFQVFRYAGTEIWADVFRCAAEALESLVANRKSPYPARGQEIGSRRDLAKTGIG